MRKADAQADVGKFAKALPRLMKSLQNVAADEKAALEALRRLSPQFIEVLHTEVLAQKSVPENAAGKVMLYLVQQYHQLNQVLVCALEQEPSAEFRMMCWRTLLDFVRAERVGCFSHELFNKAAYAFLSSKLTTTDDIKAVASEHQHNWDVRYFWLRQVQVVSQALAEGSLTQEWQNQQPASALFAALSEMRMASKDTARSWCGGLEAGLVETAPLRREGVKGRRKRKRAEGTDSEHPRGTKALWATPQAQLDIYSDAWLAFLNLRLPKPLLKSVLPTVTSHVILELKNPILLSDFLTAAIEEGGLIGILSLRGLFHLVTQHGLEHPDFYKRLYTLLGPQVFTARYRAQFLQLMDIFLASPMMPAYAAAAFAKKFARLSVSAPPAGALSCLAFIHNLIRRHPGCMCLVHRPNFGSGKCLDPYVAEGSDLEGCNALDSCLWELSASVVHMDSNVAQLSRRFNQDLSNRKVSSEVDMQMTVSCTYGTELLENLDKTLRRPPRAGHFNFKDPSTHGDLDIAVLPGCRP